MMCKNYLPFPVTYKILSERDYLPGYLVELSYSSKKAGSTRLVQFKQYIRVYDNDYRKQWEVSLVTEQGELISPEDELYAPQHFPGSFSVDQVIKKWLFSRGRLSKAA